MASRTKLPANERKLLGSSGLAAGRYRLESVLGQGGMGRVWRAFDTVENHPVALKEMRLSTGSMPLDEAATAALDVAFKREFYTMTKLQHPNVVKVFDYGVLDSGDRFITMEIVDGSDVSSLVSREPLSIGQASRILLQLAQVLGFIHSRLYVHCDIKSDNLRLTSKGALKLMDFGLMHQLGTPAGGALKGTVHYMAPEIPRGGVIDARTDLYSLGVLAFELLTGRFPFDGNTMIEIIGQHLDKPPPPVSTYRRVPDGLSQVVSRLLAKDPSERFQSAADACMALAEFSGETVHLEDYGARTSYLHCAELVGRNKEQTLLRSALDALASKESKNAFVSAPAGVGKTRLLQEFRLAVKLADIPYSLGQCRAEGQAPLAPIVEALTPLIAASSPELRSKYASQLQHVLPKFRQDASTSLPAAPDRTATHEALQAWLREYGAEHAFVLCIEDLHWADATTLEYLNVVLRALRGTRGMVLGTFRSNEVDRFSVLFQTVDEGLTQRIELSTFSIDDTTTLVTTMLGGLPVPNDFLQRLHLSTNGNAFFITETMRVFIEENLLVLEAGEWKTRVPAAELSLPASIEEAVERRLRTLTERTLTFCRAIAPMSRWLELRVVKAVTQLVDDDLFSILDELIEHQFIQKVDDDYYFSHDTVREGIYILTPIESRRAAHQRIGDVFEHLYAKQLDEQAALLGYHFSRAANPAKATDYLLRAADDALGKQSMLRATELLTEAADLIENSDGKRREERLIAVWAKIVEVGVTGKPASAARYASKLFDAWGRRIDLQRGVTTFHATSRKLSQGGGLFRAKRLQKLWSDQPLRPESRDPLHVVPKLFIYRSMQAFSYSSAGQETELARTVKQQYDDNPDPGPFRASAFIGEAIQLMHTGQWTKLAQGARDAKAWHEDHIKKVGLMPRHLWKDYAWSHHFICLEQAMTGQPLDQDVWQRGIELTTEKRFPDVQFFLRASLALRAALLGDLEELQSNYDSLVDVLRKMGNPQMAASRLPMWVGMFWLQRREKELADAICSKLEWWHERLPHDRWMRRYALTHRAIYDGDYSPADRANESLVRAATAAEELGEFRLLVHLLAAMTRFDLANGRPDEARHHAERAHSRAHAAATASPLDQVVADRLLGECIGGDTGTALAEGSAVKADSLGSAFHRGASLFTVAKLCLVSDRRRASEALTEAQELLTKCKAQSWLEQLAAFRMRAGGTR